MYIAAVTDKYQVEASVRWPDGKHYFSGILTCTDIGHGKDKPIICREAIDRLGTDKMEGSLHT